MSGRRLPVQAALLATLLFFGAPFLWVLAAAFDAASGGAWPWPDEPTLANFRLLFAEHDAGPALLSSLVVAIATALGATAISATAGYCLSRLRVRGVGWLAVGLLLIQSIPLSATMVPLYDLARRLGLRDSLWGLIVVQIGVLLPLLTWLLKHFFDSVPQGLEEAAWLDGATRWRAWAGVVLPVARGGLAVAAGLAFVMAWAEVMFPLILLDRPATRPVSLAFYRTARDARGLSGTSHETVAAFGVIYLLPVLVAFLAIRSLLFDRLSGGLHGE
ncbi:MAG: carbohydrate ABC transporter permease [Chloroflexia bacterium]|nr:carbohydrate ABC transporter permease [Chloroflexia bacterium]